MTTPLLLGCTSGRLWLNSASRRNASIEGGEEDEEEVVEVAVAVVNF